MQYKPSTRNLSHGQQLFHIPLTSLIILKNELAFSVPTKNDFLYNIYFVHFSVFFFFRQLIWPQKVTNYSELKIAWVSPNWLLSRMLHYVLKVPSTKIRQRRRKSWWLKWTPCIFLLQPLHGTESFLCSTSDIKLLKTLVMSNWNAGKALKGGIVCMEKASAMPATDKTNIKSKVFFTANCVLQIVFFSLDLSTWGVTFNSKLRLDPLSTTSRGIQARNSMIPNSKLSLEREEECQVDCYIYKKISQVWTFSFTCYKRCHRLKQPDVVQVTSILKLSSLLAQVCQR